MEYSQNEKKSRIVANNSQGQLDDMLQKNPGHSFKFSFPLS